MDRIIAKARAHTIDTVEVLRVVIVSGCAIALIAAGPAFPF